MYNEDKTNTSCKQTQARLRLPDHGWCHRSWFPKHKSWFGNFHTCSGNGYQYNLEGVIGSCCICQWIYVGNKRAGSNIAAFKNMMRILLFRQRFRWLLLWDETAWSQSTSWISVWEQPPTCSIFILRRQKRIVQLAYHTVVDGIARAAEKAAQREKAVVTCQKKKEAQKPSEAIPLQFIEIKTQSMVVNILQSCWIKASKSSNMIPTDAEGLSEVVTSVEHYKCDGNIDNVVDVFEKTKLPHIEKNSGCITETAAT